MSWPGRPAGATVQRDPDQADDLARLSRGATGSATWTDRRRRRARRGRTTASERACTWRWPGSGGSLPRPAPPRRRAGCSRRVGCATGSGTPTSQHGGGRLPGRWSSGTPNGSTRATSRSGSSGRSRLARPSSRCPAGSTGSTTGCWPAVAASSWSSTTSPVAGVPTTYDVRSSMALALYALAVARTFRRPCLRVELHHLPTGEVVGAPALGGVARPSPVAGGGRRARGGSGRRRLPGCPRRRWPRPEFLRRGVPRTADAGMPVVRLPAGLPGRVGAVPARAVVGRPRRGRPLGGDGRPEVQQGRDRRLRRLGGGGVAQPREPVSCGRRGARRWPPAARATTRRPARRTPPGRAARARPARRCGRARVSSCWASRSRFTEWVAMNLASSHASMSGGGASSSFCASICRLAAQIVPRSTIGRACAINVMLPFAGAGTAAGPELIRVSEQTAPGSARAAARTTRPPKEWPTRCAGRPSPSRTARTSSASAATSYAAGSSRPTDSNWPRWSSATTGWPAAAIGARRAMKSSLEPVYPGTSSTGAPVGSAGSARSAASGPRGVAIAVGRTPVGWSRYGGLLTSRNATGPRVTPEGPGQAEWRG